MPDRQEYIDLLQRSKRDRARKHSDAYRAIAQAEVPVKQITNRGEWNWFLQVLQAMKADSQRQLDSAVLAELDAPHWDAASLAMNRALRQVLRERVRCLEEVMDLPKVVLEDAERAKEILAKYAESEPESDSDAA